MMITWKGSSMGVRVEDSFRTTLRGLVANFLSHLFTFPERRHGSRSSLKRQQCLPTTVRHVTRTPSSWSTLQANAFWLTLTKPNLYFYTTMAPVIKNESRQQPTKTLAIRHKMQNPQRSTLRQRNIANLDCDAINTFKEKNKDETNISYAYHSSSQGNKALMDDLKYLS